MTGNSFDSYILDAIQHNDLTLLFDMLLPAFNSKTGVLAFIGNGLVVSSYVVNISDGGIKKFRGVGLSGKPRLPGSLAGVKETAFFVENGESPYLLGNDILNRSIYFVFAHMNKIFAVMQIGEADREFGEDAEPLADEIQKYLFTHFVFLYEYIIEGNKRKLVEKRLNRSETGYRKIFNAMQDLVYTAEADGTITDINDAGANLLGYSRKEDLVGMNIKDFHGDKKWNRVFSERLQKQGTINDFEDIFYRQDGSAIYCLESAHAEQGSGGEIQSITGVIKDISDRINMEKELWKLNLELTKANDMLRKSQEQIMHSDKLASIGQLSAGIAHELNNPLSFVKTNFNTMRKYLETFGNIYDELNACCDDHDVLEIIKDRKIPVIREELPGLFSETAEGISRMSDIVSSLNAFSRSDDIEKRDWADINKCIDMALMIAKNQYKYYAHVEKSLNNLPECYCNEGKIKQVVLNLVVNASQALEEAGMKNSTGRIRIMSSHQKDDIVLTIEDNGPGISEENIEKVIQPFYTTKDVGKGTGLGLSISYEIIVGKHNGTFKIGKSKLGGAKFEISIPIK